MKLVGTAIATNLLTDLATQVSGLTRKGVQPTLAVILVGEDPGSVSYIRQKERTAQTVGIAVVRRDLPVSVTPRDIRAEIDRYNRDDTVHGIIIQRPIPSVVGDTRDTLTTVVPAKDVDGFLPNSPFEVPVAKAVLLILDAMHADVKKRGITQKPFIPWLTEQTVCVLGKGETAGKPITDLLRKYGCTVSVVDSKTAEPKIKLQQASIVISCVGKRRTVRASYISRGTMCISVGISRDAKGKLHGDYEELDIAKKALFYTPTPGGVGPVNVACLMKNVVDACIIQNGRKP